MCCVHDESSLVAECSYDRVHLEYDEYNKYNLFSIPLLIPLNPMDAMTAACCSFILTAYTTAHSQTITLF